MRLIDADALKIDLMNLSEETGMSIIGIFDLINNAPTIEPFKKIGAICNENCGGYRPKGKWIEVDNGLVSGRCSLCGWEAVIMETDVCDMPFCPNCGADMRGDV